MEMKLQLSEARENAIKYMKKGYHCGPALLQVMWEAYDMKDESYLWSCIPFMGGISGQNKATCGAVSAAAVVIGLRHRTSLSDKKNAKIAREKARVLSSQVVKNFIQKFGDVTCQELLGIDFTKPGAYRNFRKANTAEQKCYQYVNFLIEALYALET